MATCKSCKFFDQHAKSDQNDEAIGWCRRYPPFHLEPMTFTHIDPLSIEWYHPTVRADHDWCGEYQEQTYREKMP